MSTDRIVIRLPGELQGLDALRYAIARQSAAAGLPDVPSWCVTCERLHTDAQWRGDCVGLDDDQPDPAPAGHRRPGPLGRWRRRRTCMHHDPDTAASYVRGDGRRARCTRCAATFPPQT